MLLLFLDTLLSAGIFPFTWAGIRALRTWVRVPPAAPPADDRAPFVTILVPARNEERSIERCVRSLLAQRYPRDRVRVLAIDDRSSDATPAILARLASEDDRLVVLHGQPLPAGWLGKCWALHQAARQADPRSSYLLCVDADTVHAPAMLAAVVRYTEQHQVALLSLVPDQELGSAAERLLLPTVFGVIGTAHGTLDEVNDPARPRVAKAVGQFLLFRADVYRALGGHEAVKDEIVEDFAFARRVKGTGFRLVLADGRQLVRTRMYHSAHEIWEGFSKNAFDEAQRHSGGALGGLISLPVLAVGPWLMSFLGARRVLRRGAPGDLLLLAQGLLQAFALLALGALSAQTFGLPARYGLAQPLSGLFLWGILANSTWRTLSGQGVVWKGRTVRPGEG